MPTLNQNLLNTLLPIAQATTAGTGMFCNSKSPVIRGLVSANAVRTDNEVDPANADKHRYFATEAGLMEVGMAMPAAQTADAGVTLDRSAEETGDGSTATDQVVSTTVRATRVGRIAPTIMRSAVRIPIATVGDTADGRKAETYPFASLLPPDEQGNGDSFFVAADAQLTDPTKQLGGTVSGANRRYRDSGDSRQFKIIRVNEDQEHKGPDGKGLAGARIIRVK